MTPNGHAGCTAQQQDGLDDLHPGGGLHAAQGNVEDDQHADDDNGSPVGDLRNQRVQQLPGAHQLADQVPDDDDQRADGRHDANRGLLETEGDHVGVGVFTEVAQTLGDQEQDDRPADQPADREDQAVEAVHVDQGGDSQERGCRHVVAGNGHAVLKTGDAAAGGIEVGRGLRPLCRPVGDVQGDADKDKKHDDGVPVDRDFRRNSRDSRGGGTWCCWRCCRRFRGTEGEDKSGNGQQGKRQH